MSKIHNISKTLLVFIRMMIWFLFGGTKGRFSRIYAAYQSGGFKLGWKLAVEKFSKKSLAHDCQQNQLSLSQNEFLLARCTDKPLISIITPVYKVEVKWLQKCINSVVNQHYSNWELVLIDDASGQNDIKELLKYMMSLDKRIRAIFLEHNSGIVNATNSGLKEAKGEFIGFLDHDDELTPDALTWMVWTLNKNQGALWLYSDEDKISKKSRCHSPYFKPDFSPELLLSNMFTCHFSVYSAEIIKQVGGLRAGFDGAQDHDMALRISEIISNNKIIHIPRILYHWRELDQSTASAGQAKPQAAIAGRKAVSEALQRRNIEAQVSSSKIHPTFYEIEFKPKDFPKVSVIIPIKNSLSLTKQCLDSLRSHTAYPNYNIVIIDNQSDDKDVLEYLSEQESKNMLSVIKYDKPFNHSEMNNIAIKSVDSKFVVFMNNDIEIISDNWLEQLIATIQIDEKIACVGCLLLFKDRTVQHGGIILGLNSIAGHAHRNYSVESGGYFGRLHALQEMSGVTAALAIMRRSAFEAVGGFNAQRYPTSFNDVDLAIRLRMKGYRYLYNPMVQAFHYESKTRCLDPKEMEYQQRIKDDYSDILNKDPFYNPNLSLDNEQFLGFRSFLVEEQIVELKKFKK
jgi:O-antigen biosynthesis protein